MKIGIVGTGTMGSGIVQQFATYHDVVLVGRRQVSIDKLMAMVEKNLNRSVEKGRLEEAKRDEILGRITTSLDRKDLKDADVVVEAIPEVMEQKIELFSDLDEICDEKTILCTNTSSLSITEIAMATKRPEKVSGLHFFNPVPVMKLIEVISGVATSKETEEMIVNLSKEIDKTPVIVKEAPGFVVNRILVPMINEAIGIYADGVASAEDIDQAMKLGANHPIGPLALGDMIGLDVCLNIMDVLYNEFNDPKYRAHTLLRKMVRGNKLGRKTKEGFYTY